MLVFVLMLVFGLVLVLVLGGRVTLPANSWLAEIRSTKSEIRNKSKIRSPNFLTFRAFEF